MKFRSLGEAIKIVAKRYKNQLYVLNAEDGTKLSYQELDQLTSQVANFLQQRGFQKGDKIALFLSNLTEFVYLYFGIIKSGCVVVAINNTLKPKELEDFLQGTNSKFLFAEKKDQEKLRMIKLPKFLVNTSTQNLPKELQNYPEKHEDRITDPEAAAVIAFSSGTTGKSKYIQLSHRFFLKQIPGLIKHTHFQKGERFLCVQPLFFPAYFMYMYQPLFGGGNFILTQKFSKSKFWQRAAEYKVNYILTVPTMLTMLLNPPEDISKYDLSPLKIIFCSSAPLSPKIIEKFEKEFQKPIIEGLGTNEAGYVTMNPRDLTKRKIGSIGVPLAGLNQVKIFDEKDQELPTGEQGEIVAKGNVLTAYYKYPQATKEALRGGWYHTGDLGYQDEEGYFYITGRIKFIINRGGEKIVPKQVDDVLQSHPAVVNSCTIGVPDEIYGEEVKSYVVLKEGQKLNPEELIEYCKKHLAEYKCPKSLSFLAAIPLNATGKPLVRELLKLHQKGI